MATLLLIVIYIAFIGLGIPDSLFGTAWPAIYAELNIPFSFASFLTVIISCGTVISSLLSARLINKFGTDKVSAFSTLLTAAALLGFSFSGKFYIMCLLAVPLGIGAGAIDVALNNYVALHYSATHMNFLHCFYGVGVSVSPYILSRVINSEYGWRGGFKIAFLLQISIAALLFVTLPLWKKAPSKEDGSTQPVPKTISFREALRIPGVKLMCCLFITSCAIECTCGVWGSTFLVEYKHLTVDKAAQIIMWYYIGITVGRFLSGVLATKLHSWTIIRIGQIILGCALTILFIPGSAYISAIGLFLVGCGNGPLFPNFNYLAPESFGKDISQSVIGVQMGSAYIGIMLAPMLCGFLGQVISMAIFPIYLIVFFIIMLYATIRVRRVLKINGKNINSDLKNS